MHSVSRLAIGTAQFGLRYGVSNQRGQIPKEEIQEILARSFEAGVNTLDTAIGYGNAESQLGSLGVTNWRIISKLPSIPDECLNVTDWIERETDASLSRLRIRTLSGLLLHRATDLLGTGGDRTYHALQKLKNDGRVKKIGVSIYDFHELSQILDRYELDLVQAPFNCIDRRLIDSGWITGLNLMGVELHVRSIFLQGLLLMPPETRPRYFGRWKGLLEIWDNWLTSNGADPIETCLGLPASRPEIDRTIVGVDSLKHLDQILNRAQTKVDPPLPDEINCSDLDLIDPSRWKVGIT